MEVSKAKSQKFHSKHRQWHRTGEPPVPWPITLLFRAHVHWNTNKLVNTLSFTSRLTLPNIMMNINDFQRFWQIQHYWELSLTKERPNWGVELYNHKKSHCGKRKKEMGSRRIWTDTAPQNWMLYNIWHGFHISHTACIKPNCNHWFQWLHSTYLEAVAIPRAIGSRNFRLSRVAWTKFAPTKPVTTTTAAVTDGLVPTIRK